MRLAVKLTALIAIASLALAWWDAVLIRQALVPHHRSPIDAR